MRKVILCLVGLLTIAWHPAAAEDAAPAAKPPTAPKSCRETMTGHMTTEQQDRACLAMAGPLAGHRKDGLSIKLDDGTRKFFRDDEAAEVGYGYALLDYYPAFHRFVVTNVSDDAGKTTVVDGRTGKTMDLGFLFPYFSPDGRWILLGDNRESGGEPSVFTLVAADDPKRTPLWSSASDTTTLSTRAFEFSRWLSDTRVRFELGKAKTPIFLARDAKGHWRYDLGDDPEPAPPPDAAKAEPPAAPKP